MDLQYYGGNTFRLQDKKTVLTIDDTLVSKGKASITKPDDIALFTEKDFVNTVAKHTIQGPGEYEVSELMILGVSLPLHRDETAKSTAYIVHTNEASICFLGHTTDTLSDLKLEEIGLVDVLVIPVGGHGYTLDAVGARKLIKKIEPKAVVLSHFDDGKTNYEVPQADLDTIIKELAIEPTRVESLKLKSFELETAMQVYVLETK